MNEEGQGIVALHAEWVEAMRESNVARLLSLMHEDYVLWAAGVPPMQGRDAVRPALEAAFSRFEIDPSFVCEARVVEGDLAIERGWDVQVLRPRAGGDEITQRQRVMLVATKGTDGQWRFLWGMSQPSENPGGTE
jgi:uncharacterized protein (TIGR02246 family)